MVEHISNTENMEDITPFIILLVCLIVAHAVVTRLSKKKNASTTSWFSKPTVEKDQSEDNKTEEESNPSPKMFLYVL